MVSLSDVRASNSQIASKFPSGLVAVFVGATSGIGEAALKQFARYCSAPRIYFIGRSQEAGDRITAELRTLNAKGEYTFIKADVSLIKVVDDVCRDIKNKEKYINVLLLSQGTAVRHTKTSEGMHAALCLPIHSRNRFTVNLLPLLQQATGLRRVVSVLGATYEGDIDATDFQAWNIGFVKERGHLNSMADLSLEAIARNAPDVTFINGMPGLVNTGLLRGTTGFLMAFIKALFTVFMPFMGVPLLEVGDRFTFLATSAKYPPRTGENAGIPVKQGIRIEKGTDGQVGSGVYSIAQPGESSGPKVEAVLARLRKEGMVDKVWNHNEEEFKRITGVVAI